MIRRTYSTDMYSDEHIYKVNFDWDSNDRPKLGSDQVSDKESFILGEIYSNFGQLRLIYSARCWSVRDSSVPTFFTWKTWTLIVMVVSSDKVAD